MQNVSVGFVFDFRYLSVLKLLEGFRLHGVIFLVIIILMHADIQTSSHMHVCLRLLNERGRLNTESWLRQRVI